MHYKDVLKVKAIRSGNACDWLMFKKCRNAINNEIKQAKEQFFKNALRENKGNSRMTWRIINELTSRKIHSSSVKEINSVTIELLIRGNFRLFLMIIFLVLD